ncbi:MAG TPA: A/G-specific adenine glycosylase [Longimicrobiales bacterium]
MLRAAASADARRVEALAEGRRLSAIRRALLRHYDRHRRELPWRGTSDPYRVWISEIMLQQTRADVVVPYYERWLERFPTLDALADAELDDVLRAWQGLGYYARARNLHRAARLVRERHGGVLPRDAASLRALPGVGAYTAGAIASIAFGEPCPAVDGNVRRVLARLFDLADAAPATLHDLAARLIPRRRAGDFNQALMDLGATLCSPRRPACGECPVARWCLARARGTQAERPARRKRPEVPTYDVGTAVLRAHDGRLLLVRRPEDGLLGGMWSFPGEVARDGESVEDAAMRAGRAASGLATIGRGRPLGTVAHVFSHRREVYHVFVFAVPATGAECVSPHHEQVEPHHDQVELRGDRVEPRHEQVALRRGRTALRRRQAAPRRGRAASGDDLGQRVTPCGGARGVWVAPEELERYALPAAQRRILRLVEEE